MSDPSRRVLGAILAGGEARRLAGNKAGARLAGRPLVSYSLAAMRAALGETGEVVVVAKRSTALPALDKAAVWLEPDEPSHPLVGLVHALERAAGRAVLVCAVDLPLVSAATLQRLATFEVGAAPAVVATDGQASQPLLGRYEATALAPLRRALERRSLPAMRELVAELGAAKLAVPAVELSNVNTPEDLARAEASLVS